MTADVRSQYCELWQRGGLYFHENGGRKENECLDMNFVIGKRAISITLWDLGKFSKLIKWIPTGKYGRGFALGIAPIGAKE